MKQIDLSDYSVDTPVSDGDKVVTKALPYKVRESLIAVLFAPEGLPALELLARDDLGRKIRDWEGEELLIEDADYDKLKTAVEAFRRFGRNDVEFVKRVFDAKALSASELKAKKGKI